MLESSPKFTSRTTFYVNIVHENLFHCVLRMAFAMVSNTVEVMTAYYTGQVW